MVKSLYFVVIENIKIPKPKDKPAINIIKKGNNNIYILGVTLILPHIEQPIYTKINSNNWMKNLNKFDVTTDNGTISLGKQTLPNILAFEMKVLDVQLYERRGSS